MARKAQCCCGALQVDVSGDPAFVLACHCGECQRRTGSVFGVSAYYSKGQVQIGASGKVYVREGQEARKLTLHFCPDCGTTVYWEAEFRPDHVGIAVGTFSDPEFPVPTRSIWEETRHHWVTFEHQIAHSPRQSTPRQ